MILNPLKVIRESIAALDTRLIKNSEIIAEDHGEIIELKTQNRDLVKLIEALSLKIDTLEEKQSLLRGGLFEAVTNPKADGTNCACDPDE